MMVPTTGGGWLLAAVPWLLVIAGWLYATRQANQRETRKELRDELQGIDKALQGVVDLAKQYSSNLTSEEDRVLLLARLHFSVKVILQSAERLIDALRSGASNVVCNQAVSYLDAYYELATGDQLDKAFSANAAGKEMFYIDLQNAGLELLQSLYVAFRVKYPAA